MKKCPACRVNYANVSEHLRDVHGISDKNERRLLLAIQSGRYAGPLTCPEARCKEKTFVRLDRHLAIVHKVTDEGKKEIMKEARQNAIKDRLKMVRVEKDNRKDIAALQAVVGDLQKEVSKMRTEGESHTKQKKKKKEDGAEKTHGIEDLLGKFKAVLLGSNPGRKGKSNVSQVVTHVRLFLTYMWGREGTPSQSLSFVKETEKVILWVKELRRDKAVTTIKHYLLDVKKFVSFLREENFKEVRLSQNHMLCLERTLKREMSSVSKEIVTHRQEVHSEKSKKLLTVDQLSNFKVFAAKEIPKSLNKLKKAPLKDTYSRQCVGLLAGYLFALSGHRKGVLVSLLEKEVIECERSDDNYVIYAKSHKTAATYGRAKLALTKDEYAWLTAFSELRPLLPGYSPDVPTFFFSSTGGELEKLGEMVTDIWHRAGVSDVTVTLIRSSLSTVAQRHLEPSARSKVTRAMCHSNLTSDKFYVGEESVSEAHATRSMLDEVVSPSPTLPAAKAKGKKRSKRMRLASSSDCDEPGPPPATSHHPGPPPATATQPGPPPATATQPGSPPATATQPGSPPATLPVEKLQDVESDTAKWTEDLKKGIRTAFASVWQEVITTDMIADILCQNEQLLKKCAILNMKMKTVAKMIAQLQTEDSREAEDV